MDFYNSIAEYYENIFPLKPAKCSFVLDNIKNIKNAYILDIGCATGELSAAIAESDHIHKIEAIDLDEPMIKLAKAKYPSPKIEFSVLDMTLVDQVYKNNQFDAVVCFGNTLVHLPDRDIIYKMISGIKKVLKDNGIFLLQILNYEHILKNGISTLPLIDNKAIKFKRTYTLGTGRIGFDTELTLKETGRVIKNRINLYPLVKDDLHNMFLEAGFSTIEYYSSFNAAPYTGSHIPLIIKSY